ncbi:MAG TPA: TetR/AcrR family transcriptional regulator [Pseudonocardia sp.]|jgi:AcrR family transcriptional regulator
MPVEIDALSPKQLLKRRQIVEAAKEVLMEVGPAACTTREIARSGHMNQGLIYYYFSTVEEIVDAAMESLFAELTEGIAHAGTGHNDPASRFWAVLEDYLGVFDRHPNLSLVWFEYWTTVTRAGRVDKVERLQDGLIDLLTTLLADAGVEDAPARARVILAYVLGVLVRRTMHPQSIEELRPEIASLAGISLRPV